MPLRACPDCSTEVPTRAITCPKCGRAFWRLHMIRVALPLCGLGMSLCGASMLYLLARPIIGLGPFTSWQRDEFTGFLLDLRWLGFGAIALGLITIAGSYLWLRRINSRRSPKRPQPPLPLP
jgi:hypothetical protein